MLLPQITVGDIIQFVVRVENSGQNQPIQNVMLKVSEITNTHIRGVNAIRTLNSDEGKIYRTYRLTNIVQGTVWKMLA